jgi:hypothetical protein
LEKLSNRILLDLKNGRFPLLGDAKIHPSKRGVGGMYDIIASDLPSSFVAVDISSACQEKPFPLGM